MDSQTQRILDRIQDIDIKLNRLTDRVKIDLGNGGHGRVQQSLSEVDRRLEKLLEIDKKVQRTDWVLNGMVAIISAFSLALVGAIGAAIASRLF